MWQQVSMYEVWQKLSEEINGNLKGVFLKPELPTRRWNKITTKTSTQEKTALEKYQKLILEKSRISKCKETSLKYKCVLYKLEVFKPKN